MKKYQVKITDKALADSDFQKVIDWVILACKNSGYTDTPPRKFRIPLISLMKIISA